ncbi:MAG: hypothetical protein AB7T49_19035 [Oligoflexales bacterium]
MKQLAILLSLFAIGANAAELPKDWKTWKSVKTPLVEVGAVPDCKADVSKLPTIYQKTVATYCNLRPQGPGKVQVLVKPDQIDAYKARNGSFKDGAATALYFPEIKAMLLTSYKGGQPVYSVHQEDGKDITAASGALSVQACTECHTGYAAFCKGGQCGTYKGE